MDFKSSTIFVCLLMLASTVAYSGKCFVNNNLAQKSPNGCPKIPCDKHEGLVLSSGCDEVALKNEWFCKCD